MSTDLVGILAVLERVKVRYVVIGAAGAVLHGAPAITEDIDITPARDDANLVALAAALQELEARMRVEGEPAGLTFPIEPTMLGTAEVWNLSTRLGDLDIAFRPSGTDGYRDLARDASTIAIADALTVRVASLRDIIRSKQAAGRAKDLAVLPLLRETLERRENRDVRRM
ncbi:MAG: hypothetical protein NVSMB25_10790 [Thermoleophilaceae bacterium]